jgi:aminopeptidase
LEVTRESRRLVAALNQARLLLDATAHVKDILLLSMDHGPAHKAVVFFDDRSELAILLAKAYAKALPDNARHVSFYEQSEEALKALFVELREGDLVALVQTESFQMADFRIRVELYKQGVKVLAHGNLSKIVGPALTSYVASLAYDPAYYRRVGHGLKNRINAASSATVESGDGNVLQFDSSFEEAKINIGDFSALKNIGSQFPIGEVFTEAVHLENVHGSVRIYAFADLAFRVNVPKQPITLHVAQGRVVSVQNATPEFDAVRSAIEADEGCIMLRELGFGMNRAFSPERWVLDVGAFERVLGIHLSLGAKHGVYNKPGARRRDGRHHVDVFAVTERVMLDNQVVYQDGAYTL